MVVLAGTELELVVTVELETAQVLAAAAASLMPTERWQPEHQVVSVPIPHAIIAAN